jgi:Rieske Fe-S protein
METEKAHHVTAGTSRRKFLDWLLGTSVGGLLVAVLYPVSRYIIPPEVIESTAATVTLPINPDDVPPNSAEVFRFGNQPGILIRTESGEFRAFAAACTHLACIVQFRPDIGHIWCACHNGHFDVSGRVVSGPPPSPLEAYEVNIRGDEIVVSRRI